MIYLDYTVARIKNLAVKVFYEKGFNGARIHEIANQANVSQSLLHYYFRTKEQLYKIIVDDSIDMVIKNMSPVLKKELSFFELIDQFINNILTLFKDNRSLLSFIINEYNQNFEKIKSELEPLFNFFKEFEYKIRIQSQKENITIKDLRHFIVNIISLCGWQVIGINIFNMENSNIKNSDSLDISEARKNIYESVVSSYTKKDL
ncbi:MAG: TetR/AcrR family transcriptional regulator [Bacteroidales bacterium]|jgi:TetR/AcrR family transcriptional regulator|nr:TetR/AcrR family transcriptional regulator [Bacteroidales bacterium]